MPPGRQSPMLLGMDIVKFLFKDRSEPLALKVVAVAIASFFVLVILAAVVFALALG